MNLNENFIKIQGILISVESKAGPLNKIKYRGGNEKTILNVVTELHKFLSSKNYIKNNVVNGVFNEQLKEICVFFILNTELKEPLDDPNLQHLINIMPQLSPCLLANIILGLELSKIFCEALLQFSSDVIEELLSEIIPHLKKCKLKVHVANACEFLKLLVLKISSTSNGSEQLTDVASKILLDLTGIHGDQIEDIRPTVVYECMGRCLLNFLDLLLIANNKNLEKMVEKLIQSCSSMMLLVTVDVFLSWAELQHQGEVLQGLIAEKSYLFIEKYKKHPQAKSLITMLATIAKEPKSVSEQIHSASVPKMITMINKADSSQKKWFVALLNTQVFMDKDSTECVEKWAHLCTLEDVSRLLNMSINCKNLNAKNVVVKCAATLSFEEIVLLTTRHFYHNGVTCLNENVDQQLIILFNKMKNQSIGDDFCKELYLLLLQNPKQTLTFVMGECLKNTFYSCNLGPFWTSVKEIITIDDIGITILKDEIAKNKPNDQNCKNYVQLFNDFVQNHTFTTEQIALVVILPLLQNSLNSDNDLTKNTLEILKDLQGVVTLKEDTQHLFNFLLDLMKTFRCNFVNFDGLKQEITKLCVDIFEKYANMNRNWNHSTQGVKSDDLFVSFYKGRIFEGKIESSVLGYFFPISFGNHAETVAHLIKILPQCVTPEWLLISTNLLDFCGLEKTIELLCDFVILLCEVVNSQESQTEEVKCMFKALAYCLQNLGIIIKECLQPRINTPSQDIAVTKNVCRLLKEIPKGSLKSEEGLSLASLLSDFSLKSLRSDRKFALVVASIHEPHICKMLAEKILS